MYIKNIKIGNVEIKNNIFLAPMAGVADRAFRKICAQMGAGLVFTEMVSAKGIVYGDIKTLELLKCDIPDIPKAVQIFGNNPEIMSEAIRKIEDYVDIIDINMGCPVPKVVNNGEGSALLKNPELVYNIVDKCVHSTNKPITVKIRSGWDSNNINCVEIAQKIEQAGASMLTIHGRTRSQFYTGNCNIDIIKQVKEAVKITVIGNGDVADYESFANMIKYTSVDGVMIGRGTLGNPWIFEDIIKMDSGEEIFPRLPQDILKMMITHYNLEEEYKGEYTAVREMRKHISWYLKGLPHSSEMRNKINNMENKDEIIEELTNYLQNM